MVVVGATPQGEPLRGVALAVAPFVFIPTAGHLTLLIGQYTDSHGCYG